MRSVPTGRNCWGCCWVLSEGFAGIWIDLNSAGRNWLKGGSMRKNIAFGEFLELGHSEGLT
jgi:hypothetical protein